VTIVRVVIAAMFSLLYVSLYPILTGGFVIYFYPYWSREAATLYIFGGVVLQTAFCLYWRKELTVWSVGAQVLAGLVYLALSMAKGGLYQS
jgi:hypothetical protein